MLRFVYLSYGDNIFKYLCEVENKSFYAFQRLLYL